MPRTDVDGQVYQVYVKAAAGNPGQNGDCPFCHRVLLTLEEKGIKHDTHYIDLSNKPAWLLEVNPEGTTPVMKLPKEETSTLTKDKWLTSSDDICDYLETKHSQPPLGKHADIPAVATQIFPALPKYLQAGGSEEAEAQRDLKGQVTQLDSHLKSHGPWITGHSLSAGDLALGPKLHHVQVTCKHFKDWEIPAGLDSVHKYLQDLQQHPSWKATVPPTDVVIAGWTQKLSSS